MGKREKGESWNVLSLLCRGNTEGDAQSSPPNVRIGWQSRPPDRLGGGGRSGIGNRNARKTKLVLREPAQGSANPFPRPFTPIGVGSQLSQQASQYGPALLTDVPRENRSHKAKYCGDDKRGPQTEYHSCRIANWTTFSPCIPVSNQSCCFQISVSYIARKSQDLGSVSQNLQPWDYRMLSIVKFLPIVHLGWRITTGRSACGIDGDHHEIRE